MFISLTRAKWHHGIQPLTLLAQSLLADDDRRRRLAFVVSLLIGSASAMGATETVLYSFGNNFTSDTYVPFDTVTAVGSELFGVGNEGGGHRNGGIFRINTDGSGYQVLHGFDASLGEGSNPWDGLTADGTTLYGVTLGGGAHGDGTLYKIDTTGANFQVLHSFYRAGGEPSPHGRVTVNGSELYGMTQYGGTANKGAIYRINTDGSGYALLHSFGSSSTDGTMSYGGARGSWLRLAGGTLYGVTPTGGSTAPLMGGIGYGALFKINTDGSGYTILHNFSATANDGANPYGSVTLIGNTLYGNAGVGGSKNAGIVYKINTDGTGYQIIHNFHTVSNDGTQPSGELLAVGATLYGITQAGGVTAPGGYNGDGTLFRVNTDGSGYTILHHFGVSSHDGVSPSVGVVRVGSDLFGTTNDGGANTYNTGFSYSGTGTIYKFSADTGSMATTITPAAAASAGAQWQVDGGPLQGTNTTLTGLLAGNHLVTFSAASGYTPPAPRTVTLTANQTLTVVGAYTFPQLTVQQPTGKSLVVGVTTIDFGAVPTGKTSSRSFTLKNSGLANLSGITAATDGTNSNEFVVKTTAPDTLAPGASFTLNVEFNPNDINARTAVLHIHSNDLVTPVFDVPLTGTGMIAPASTSAPTSVLAGSGEMVNLSGSATGGALSYQWLRNNVAITNAKSPSYSFAASTTNAGAYTLKASNGIGSTMSAVANIGFVSTSDATALIAEGGTLTLTVSAAAPGIQYEWRRHGVKLNNGTNPVNPASTISGATAAKLSITKAITADAEDYTCNITMPDPQNLATPLQKLSGTFTVKVALLPEMNAFTPMPWIVGGTVTDVASATNEPTSYKLTGQPTGVTIDSSGHFHGKPLVAIKTPTVYHLVITASNAKGTSAPLKLDATVQPLNADVAGSYTGPVAPSPELNSNLGGSISPIIALTGAITGTLKLGGSSFSLTGQLDSYNSGNPTANFTVGGLTVSFMVDAANHRLKFCDITDGTHHASFSAWCNRWGTTMTQPEKDALNRFLGYHTFALKADPGQTAMPQGAGYGSFTVASNGTLTAAGKLADNTSFTCATFCGPAGEVLIFQQLYSNKGSITGELDITPGTAGFSPPYGDNTLAGSMNWGRPGIAGRLYASGFILNSLTAAGGRYLTPTAPQLALGVLDDGVHTNAMLSFSAADIVNASPGIAFRFKAGSVFVPPASNPRGTTVTVKPTTGTFSGGFTLSDPNGVVGTATRPASFSGQIVRDADNLLRGYGFFLLADQPQLAGDTVNNTKQQSGKVVLEPLPTLVLNNETSYHNFKETGLVAQSIPTEVNWVAARAYGNFFGDGSVGLFTAKTTYNSSLPIAQATDSEFVFWRRQMDGSFVRDTTLLSSSAGGCLHPRKAIVADFNGDGRPDIFVAAHGYDANPFPGERCRVVLSQPGGTYIVADAASDVGFYHGAAAADVNNDGKVDVIAMRAGFSTQVVFLNQGNGTFVKEADGRLPTFIHHKNYYTVELADVDGDGIPDLIVGGHEWENALTRVYRNPGNYNFSSVTPTTIPAVSGEGVVLDFTVTGTGATRTLWMLRTSGGDGTFYQSRTIQKVQWSSQTSTLALHDRPASWMPWLIPALSGLLKGVGSDDAGLGVWVAD